ncbi:protein of unknown function [Tepidibacter aestuarii]|nr:protein of unknown function [Tepidibacter aestuarii]
MYFYLHMYFLKFYLLLIKHIQLKKGCILGNNEIENISEENN